MKFEKKTLAVVIIAILGLSLFVGLASAPGRNDPISEILEIVMGIDTKVDEIQTDLEKTTQILGSYSDSYESDGGTGNAIEITSDKPAIYTVTVSLTGYCDPGDRLSVNWATVKWQWGSVYPDYTIIGDGDGLTFTTPGYGIALAYEDVDTANLIVIYCIIVQGTLDTVVQIGEWAS